MISKIRKTRLVASFAALALCSALLSACGGGSGDTDALNDAVDAGKLDAKSLTLTSTSDKALFEPNESWQLKVVAELNNGSTQDITSKVKWSTSDSSLATVDNAGKMKTGTPVGNQDVVITASLVSLNAQLTVTVSDATLSAIEASASDSEVDECRSLTLSATGTYTDGSQRPLVTGLTWNSSDTAVATINSDSSALVTHNSGNVNVTVSRGAVTSAVLPVTVNDTLASLKINEGGEISVSKSGSSTLTVSGDYSDGSNNVGITSNSTWTSGNTGVATVDGGKVTGVSTGSTTVTAACGGLTADTTVKVLEISEYELSDLKGDTALEEGEVRQLSFYEVYTDNTKTNISSKADWEITTGDEIADINGDGKLTMKNDFSGYSGTSITVRAEYNDNSKSLTINIEK
ncbi:Ig-like domain-containing protein [Hahella aquimaris]|uniref:Ig-like domain-containing protein n=1 Tax=Hahella sp. HNIBRBA332 TaxID=3015983 RepID=UPI00273CEE40|nr:Ig-like domain-containing protein [Hahella sp. HNIBRBA332]WLQ12415.1 Ig-like domain-containing protein [Hahella sp. HNIBRBA332]